MRFHWLIVKGDADAVVRKTTSFRYPHDNGVDLFPGQGKYITTYTVL